MAPARVVKWNLFGSAKKVAEWFDNHFGEEVGITGEGDRCPLATYLQDTRPNLSDITVGYSTTTYRNSKGERVEIKNPKWVMDFVKTVDDEGEEVIGEEWEDWGYWEYDPYMDDDVWVEDWEVIEEKDNHVTGWKALNILRRIARV